MSATFRFRDGLAEYVTRWMSERKAPVMFRVLWTIVGMIDVAVEVLVQGIQARWPGVGTPTALPMIGRSRGILRGQADTDATYAAKLRGWLDRWRTAGTAYAICRELHEWLGNGPRVRVITRSGHWTTIETDGTVTRTTAAWDWDSVSNPERSGFWSDIWIVIYPTQWAASGTWGDGSLWGDNSNGFGHDVTVAEYDAVRFLIRTWKAAHTRVRCVIWTSDTALFDPTSAPSKPDGTWGRWGQYVAGSYVPSGRNVSTCRYWEIN